MLSWEGAQSPSHPGPATAAPLPPAQPRPRPLPAVRGDGYSIEIGLIRGYSGIPVYSSIQKDPCAWKRSFFPVFLTGRTGSSVFQARLEGTLRIIWDSDVPSRSQRTPKSRPQRAATKGINPGEFHPDSCLPTQEIPLLVALIPNKFQVI